jgi:hypothetical protein
VLDLRQLTVERERRPPVGAFTLDGEDGSHTSYDGACSPELARCVNR